MSDILKGFCQIHDLVDFGLVNCENDCEQCVWFNVEEEMDEETNNERES